MFYMMYVITYVIPYMLIYGCMLARWDTSYRSTECHEPNKNRLRRVQTVTVRIINILRPRQNGRHFVDNMLMCFYLKENQSVVIQISLNFGPKSPIDNKASLVLVMAWRHKGDKPLAEPVMTQFTDIGICHTASLN